MLVEQLLIEDKIFHLSKKVELLNWLVVKESSNDMIFNKLNELQEELNSIRKYFPVNEITSTGKYGGEF